MFMTVRHWVMFALLLVPFVTRAYSQEEATRGAIVVKAPGSAVEYGRKFAVIVGINYESVENRGITRLNNAENDAKQLCEVLTKYYGYEKEHVRLLLGKVEGTAGAMEATKVQLQKILESLSTSVWSPSDPNNHVDEVTIAPEDSVLFFFSGHGMQELVGESKHFLMLPSDASLDGGKSRDGKNIEGSRVLEAMSACAARHRLLILDCCHAGGVFETDVVLQGTKSTSTAGASFSRINSSSFNSRGFQAMVAAHSTETAPDGKGLNSPFSEALQKSLRTFPRYWRREPFTVRQLFSRMESVFPMGRKQSPDLRSLNSFAGDFHFIPDPTCSFESELDVDNRLRNLLIAMVPGINGNWWFEETPWMMPALRHEIVAHVEQGRSTEVNHLRMGELREAAHKYQEGLERRQSSLTKLEGMRLSHIRQMLLSRDFDRNESFKNILEDFDTFSGKVISGTATPPAAANENSPEELQAVDLHFKAVIAHRLAKLSVKEEQEKVVRCYHEALDRYQRELGDEVPESDKQAWPFNTTRALQSLCFSDYAYFLSSLPLPDDRSALQYSQRALDNLGGASLPPIEIFLVCKEGQSLFRLGMWGAANDRMEAMVKVARSMAQQQKDAGNEPHPLAAWAYKEHAWCLMDQWRVMEARELFTEARDHLEPLTHFGASPMVVAAPSQDERQGTRVDYDAVIAYLHNKHGLAIAQRYSGDSVGAAKTYGGLIEQIRTQKQRHVLDTKRSPETSYSFPEIQGRLVERLMNSLERRGDCGLFGNPQDLVQADDDYRVALREWVQHPTRDVVRRAALTDRRALALSLPSPVQDVALSRSLLEASDGWSDETTRLCNLRQSIAKGNPVKSRVQGLLADLVLRMLSSKDEDRDEVFGEWREMLDVQSREGLISRSIPRDELESLLFASRLLIEFQVQQEEFNRAKLYGDIELLTNLCRLINRGQVPQSASVQDQILEDETSVGLRRFLRPYYDLAIEAHVRLKGKHVRGALEVIDESLAGPSLGAPPEGPRLYFYNTPRASYMFMDAPGELSNVYLVANSSCLDRAQKAAKSGDSLLSLPSAFVADWRRLSSQSREAISTQLCQDDSKLICWRDDVQCIGCDWFIEKLSTSNSAAEQRKRLVQFRHFPFDVSEIGLKPCVDGGLLQQAGATSATRGVTGIQPE